MQCLQIQLLLRLLGNRFKIWAQCSFGNRLCIIVVVLLALVERLNINRRDDPRLKPQLA